MVEVIDFCKRDIYHNACFKFYNGLNYIKGRNGSGKTTLLDCVAGLDFDYKGEIIGNANCIYMNQNLYFSGRLKVSDFVFFMYKMANIKNVKDYFSKAIAPYKSIFDFETVWTKKIAYLSGGEMRLLFFLVTASIESDVYIFDEPYSGIDSYGKQIISDMLDRLSAKGKVVIVTSHMEEDILLMNPIQIIEIEKSR